MDRLAEFRDNLESVKDFLRSAGLGCVLLSDHNNVAWLTGGGRSYVSWAVDQGAARVLVTLSDVYLLTSNNEADRLESEEFRGVPWRVLSYPWWTGPAHLLGDLVAASGPVGADSYTPWTPSATLVGPEIARLRVTLNTAAEARARALGAIVGEAMATVCQEIQPGDTEFEIAGRLTRILLGQGVDVPTCLIAVDDRVFQWRHFLPTSRRLAHYAAISVCARRDGLVLSCTRLVHFGPPPQDILRRVDAVSRVDAALIAATRPGATSSQLFEIARQAYALVGFPEEWRNHHQGGLAGYKGREWFASPEGKDILLARQLVAWNPTVPGAKAEDTLLVGTNGTEIITESGGFPYVEIDTGTAVIRRPGVLVR